MPVLLSPTASQRRLAYYRECAARAKAFREWPDLRREAILDALWWRCFARGGPAPAADRLGFAL